MLTAVRQNRRLLSQVIRNSQRQYATGHLNGPLSLDPSLEALLKDADMAIAKHKLAIQPSPHRELKASTSEVQGIERSLQEREGVEEELHEDEDAPMYRKSPAARYGSQSIGAVVIPVELEGCIREMIEESDKPQLHADAKRLFYNEEGEENAEDNWATSFDARYKSRIHRERLSERDGVAFMSVALPAQYAAITAVLSHVLHRVELEYNISKVIDWGSGAGSAMWACLYAFQNHYGEGTNHRDIAAGNSSVINYVGIDKREGLVYMAKKLLKKCSTDSLNASWHKNWHEKDQVDRVRGHNVLAISAFALSSQPTSLAKKTMVKEMWESGADTIVLIDHSTKEGFENIAEAREYLLKLGRKEVEDPDVDEPIRGSYVVAPCPNDGKCPLYNSGSSKLVCGFEQRLQRPAFVRLTKHSGVGYEDIGYSYVVIRRGSRPKHPGTQLGRVGGVGRRALADMAQRMPPKELEIHDGSERLVIEQEPHADGRYLELMEEHTTADMMEALRLESYHWPKLVFPPLKKSGHIILDSCTPEAKIMRMTIPKSQGKQAFYDARKSSWGDLFPHEPKNPPQVRVESGVPGEGQHQDIGKRKQKKVKKSSASYEGLSDKLKQKKRIRRERAKKDDTDDSGSDSD